MASTLVSVSKPYWKHLFDRAIEAMKHNELDSACQLFQMAIHENPCSTTAHLDLGVVLTALGQYAEAEAAFAQACALDPSCDKAFMNRAILRAEAGQTEDAIRLLHEVIKLNPTATAYFNLGTLHRRLGQRKDSLAACQKAYDLDPNDATNELNLAFELLVFERFEEGWKHYSASHAEAIKDRNYPIAKDDRLWQGDSVDHLVLHYDQGIGDTIQSLRYVNDVSKKVQRVTLIPQPGLVNLVQHVFAHNEKIVVQSDIPDVYDCYQWITSLLINSGIDPIPKEPYIFVSRSDRWAFLRKFPMLRVGLVWAGNKEQSVDCRRSIPFHYLDRLLDTPNVKFFSLQVGRDDHDHRLYDLSHHLRNWESTAGIVQDLDLVISVDTSVAHLAGAMGKPVWLLNRYDSCWRWKIDHNATDWYPSMRIFRQPTFGDWTSVITETRRALEELAANA